MVREGCNAGKHCFIHCPLCLDRERVMMARSHDLLEVRQLARRVREQYTGEHGRAEQGPGQLLQASVSEAHHALDRQLEQASDSMPGLREVQHQLQQQQQQHHHLLLQGDLQQGTSTASENCASIAKQGDGQIHGSPKSDQPDTQCLPNTDTTTAASCLPAQHAAARPHSAPVPTSCIMAPDRQCSSSGRSVTHVAPWTDLPPKHWAQHGLTLEQQLQQGGYESHGYDVKKTYVAASSSVQRVAKPHNFTMSPDEVLRRELQAMTDAEKHMQDVRQELQEAEASFAATQPQQQHKLRSSSRPGSASSIMVKAPSSQGQHVKACTAATDMCRHTAHRPMSAPPSATVTASRQQQHQQQIPDAAPQLHPAWAYENTRPSQPSQLSFGSARPSLTGSHGSRPHSGSMGSASRPQNGASASLSRLGSGIACMQHSVTAPAAALAAIAGTSAVGQTIWEGDEGEEEALPVGDLVLTVEDADVAGTLGNVPAAQIQLCHTSMENQHIIGEQRQFARPHVGTIQPATAPAAARGDNEQPASARPGKSRMASSQSATGRTSTGPAAALQTVPLITVHTVSAALPAGCDNSSGQQAAERLPQTGPVTCVGSQTQTRHPRQPVYLTGSTGKQLHQSPDRALLATDSSRTCTSGGGAARRTAAHAGVAVTHRETSEAPSAMLTAYQGITQPCKTRPWSAPCLHPFQPCLHAYMPTYTSIRGPAAATTLVSKGSMASGANTVSGLRNVQPVRGGRLMQPTVACLGKYATHARFGRNIWPPTVGKDDSSTKRAMDSPYLLSASRSCKGQATCTAASLGFTATKRRPATAAVPAARRQPVTGGATTITLLRDNTTFVMPNDMTQRMLRVYKQLA